MSLLLLSHCEGGGTRRGQGEGEQQGEDECRYYFL